MEMSKQLILIGGIPSAGKTTLARKFVKTFGLEKEFCVDYVYFAIGDELGIKDFANPHIWTRVDKKIVSELKRKYYRDMLPTNDRVIIEGYGLMFKEDRDIIKEFYHDHEVTFFYRDIDFEDWAIQKGVVACEDRLKEFNFLKKNATIEKGTITIK